MKRTIAAAILLLLPLAASAAAPEGFASLSRREIADGWILLFDGKTTFGWTSPNDVKWTILDGMLSPQGDKPALLVTATAFADYELALEFRVKTRDSLQLLINADTAGKGTNTISGQFIRGGGWWKAMLQVKAGEVVSARFESLGAGSRFGSPATKGKTLTRAGHIALAGSGFIVRNLKLRPMHTKPLFNGKNLTAWKEFPGRKSKFRVTDEGWLNVKNGPGDLQTEGQWDNFVLRLDCISNGKHLNSGVFFRCLPDKYQQGYEAQIHNGFGDPPGKDYTLEVRDPTTHQLTEKKKEKFTAFDYGTGAIYRRQPARFPVAQDREWFTMTVVAHGRHLATWVDGVQVVDWTDNRPLADNARKGCYLKKGPISLQGHDATTDLSFRNLRLAELPPTETK